jgi:hypothetical protein
MKLSSTFLAAAGALALTLAASPSMAMTAQECSAKYNAAKTAGTLNGMKWNEFRKKECAGDAAATTTAKPDETKKPEEAKKVETPAPAAKPAVAGAPVFPKAVDPIYAKESAGKGRMHTCRDQYRANKATNGNGGLKWIQKGGGYYSECNKSLKS